VTLSELENLSIDDVEAANRALDTWKEAEHKMIQRMERNRR